ncbi:hypothetical protein Q7P37_009634 [Cladosporium fusiforme]
MSLPTALQILNTFYAAETVYMSSPPSTRSPTDMLSVISPDIKLHQSPDLPWGGEYSGHEGFLAWGEAMGKYFANLEVLEPKVFEEEGAGGGDGNEVVVRSRLRLTLKEGVVWEKGLVQVVRVERERGWIVEITPFYWDVRGLREVLGL